MTLVAQRLPSSSVRLPSRFRLAEEELPVRRHSPCRNNVIRTAIALLATASTLFGKDTAGSTMRVKSFSHPGLTKLTWTAQISEYESKEQTNEIGRASCRARV